MGKAKTKGKQKCGSGRSVEGAGAWVRKKHGKGRNEQKSRNMEIPES